ncbi:MAG: HAD family hydrolase [Clostridia bacterium]|nr:HAD family hydrolase [Clostridia bacterium]
MYEVYLFDLDGTLLDTLDDLAAAVNAALKAYGLSPRTKQEVRAFVGNGIKNLIERAIGEKNHPNFSGVFDEFKRYYKAHCKDATKPYAGVLELLQELNERGKKCAVVSNKADFAVQELSKEYFGELIAFSVGENESAGIAKKPAPDMVLKALDALGANKKNAVYIGDSEVDLQTAQNAGLPCISVTWGFKDEEFLIAHGAKTLVDEPREILKI